MNKRLLPSDLEALDVAAQTGLKFNFKCETHYRMIELATAEIRACWAEIAAATEAMRANSDEMDLLRAMAIAAAEEMMASPATDSPLFDAVREWQKSQREKA